MLFFVGGSFGICVESFLALQPGATKSTESEHAFKNISFLMNFLAYELNLMGKR